MECVDLQKQLDESEVNYGKAIERYNQIREGRLADDKMTRRIICDLRANERLCREMCDDLSIRLKVFIIIAAVGWAAFIVSFFFFPEVVNALHH